MRPIWSYVSQVASKVGARGSVRASTAGAVSQMYSSDSTPFFRSRCATITSLPDRLVNRPRSLGTRASPTGYFLILLVRQLGFIRDLGRADKVGQSRVIVRLPA